MKVLSFGEILFDVIEGESYLGGAPLNFAAHLARCGVESYIFSRIGADELGKKAIDQIEKQGVKAGLIEVDQEHPTGTVQVVLSNGQPDYTICEEVAYDYISFQEMEEELEETDFHVLYYGTLAQRNNRSRDSLKRLIQKKKFRQVFYDVNLRKGFYSREILQNSLQHCSILKLNDEEVEVLGEMFFGRQLSIEDFSQRVAKKFSIETVIVTAGAKGCLLFDKGMLHFVKGVSVEVVDTVGAGDSFSAAFLFQYLKHGDAVKAAGIANQLGAFVASCRGPIPEYALEIKQALGLEEIWFR